MDELRPDSKRGSARFNSCLNQHKKEAAEEMKRGKIAAIGLAAALIPTSAFPQRVQVLTLNCHSSPGAMRASGEVKNISNTPLHDLMPSVIFRDSHGIFISSNWHSLDRNPLLPGQTSRFEVAEDLHPAIGTVELQILEWVDVTADKKPMKLSGITSAKCER